MTLLPPPHPRSPSFLDDKSFRFKSSSLTALIVTLVESVLIHPFIIFFVVYLNFRQRKPLVRLLSSSAPSSDDKK